MVLFVFATTAAPGPNAALLLTVGARLGIGAGVPVILGLATANAAMKGAIAAGVRILAELDPLVIQIGRWIAVAATLWLAWRLMRKLGGVASHAGVAGFWDAFAFQIVNPKAVITGLAAAALFCTAETGGIGHAIAFFVVAFPSVLLGGGSWLLVGHAGAAWLRGPKMVRVL
ncbi:LysE family translocator, partial [uncultured Jannaschia sp.]